MTVNGASVLKSYHFPIKLPESSKIITSHEIAEDMVSSVGQHTPAPLCETIVFLRSKAQFTGWTKTLLRRGFGFYIPFGTVLTTYPYQHSAGKDTLSHRGR